MKSASKKRRPSIVNLTVKLRYLTEREVERLMDCARKHGRYGRSVHTSFSTYDLVAEVEVLGSRTFSDCDVR